MTINTKIEHLTFRFAEEKDIPLILSLIKELAVYEKMPDQVSADEESLKNSLLERDASGAVHDSICPLSRPTVCTHLLTQLSAIRKRWVY